MRYTRALESSPAASKSGHATPDPRLYLHRSVAFRQLGCWKHAEQDAVKAVKLQPLNTAARCNLVICLNLLRRWPEALCACDIGLTKQPHSSALLRLRSEVLREKQAEQPRSPALMRLRSEVLRGQQTKTFKSHVRGCQTGFSMPPASAKMRAPFRQPSAEPGAAGPAAETRNVSETLSLGAASPARPAQMAEEMLPRRDAREAVQAHDVWAKRSKLLRRSKFTRKMSLWWRLCRSELPGKQPPRQQMGECGWKQFTPTVLNMERCNARTWNAGLGGQCSKAKCGSDSDFCRAHMAGEKWRTHGRVDGAIPVGKLREFLRTRPPEVSVRSSTAAASRQKPDYQQKHISAGPHQQQVSHVGNHVRFRGDGRGVGHGGQLGVVVGESADSMSFTSLMLPAGGTWSTRQVLKRYCILLQDEHQPSLSPRPALTKKRLSTVLGPVDCMPHLVRKKRCVGAYVLSRRIDCVK